MAEEEEQPPSSPPTSPFWIQTTANRRRVSALFFNSFFLIICLLFFLLLSMFFIIPSLVHSSSNTFSFRPNSFKRSWDSVNLVLVLIALVFGFLSRNAAASNNDDERLNLDDGSELTAGDTIMYDESAIGLTRQRTSVSYPDLRELSPPWGRRDDDPWRFSDDTHLNYYHVVEGNRNSFRQRSRREYGLCTYTPPVVSPAPPQPPVKKKKKKRLRDRSFDNLGDGLHHSNSPAVKLLSPEEKFQPPPPPPPPPLDNHTVFPSKKQNLKKFPSITHPPSPPHAPPLVAEYAPRASTTRLAMTSFNGIDDNSSGGESPMKKIPPPLLPPSLPAVKFQPPPPPPPSPPHAPPLVAEYAPRVTTARLAMTSFNGIDDSSSGGESPMKKIPPPPLPAEYGPRATVTRLTPFVTDKQGPAVMTTNFNVIDDSSSGGESPMKKIPPPPPLPPFKMPDWKFAVEGDFVRLQSTVSSRSGSPDGDEAQSPSSDVDTAAAMAIFCTSPDVDSKADKFIAKFRAGLKLERMSKLGPGPVSGPNII